MTEERIVEEIAASNDEQIDAEIFKSLLIHAASSILLYRLTHGGKKPYVAGITVKLPEALIPTYEKRVQEFGTIGVVYHSVNEQYGPYHEINILYLGEREQCQKFVQELNEAIVQKYPSFEVECREIGR